jgi:hypothetical protein
MNTDFANLPGVAETGLSPDQLAELPATAPPAPWTATACGIAWWARPDTRARAALRDALPTALRDAQPLLTTAAMITYTDTPVGAYSETLALVVLRRGTTVFAHVPFIAVDSLASVVGGRTNWALPKTLAKFDGRPADDTTITAHAPTWRITATPRAHGPALPVPLPPLLDLLQPGPHGETWTSKVRGHLRARYARIDVQIVAAPLLAEWFPTGPCTGILSQRMTGKLPAAQIER